MKRMRFLGLMIGVFYLFFGAGALMAAGDESPAVRAAMLVEDAFSEVVERAKPAVVVITNKQRAPAPRELPPEFYFFFGQPVPPQRGPGMERRNKPVPAGKGSGVIISEEGHLVTNYHVIENHEFLEVKTADGTVYDNEKDADAVTVVGVDPETDLAVLQLRNGKKEKYPFLRFTDAEKVRVGQWVIAIGAPFNLDYSVTVGCVSQKGRYDMGMSTYDNYIQTDASINPGNSGGPLLNIHGEIVGINQFIMTGGPSRGSIGLGFAIASDLVKQVVDVLVEDGEVIRPFLGISMQELTGDFKDQFDADFGVIVSGLVPGEAAEKAGIKAGDVIQQIGEKTVHSMHDLRLAVTSYRPGDTIKVTLLRDGKEMIFHVVASRRGADGDIAGVGRSSRRGQSRNFGKLGLNLSEKDGHIVVSEVLPDGAVANAGDGEMRVMPGDIIHEVNRKTVKTIAEMAEVVNASDKNNIVLRIERKLPNRTNSYYFYFAVPMTDNDK
jgi:serine protease Do